jgi:hypothetical protein
MRDSGTGTSRLALAGAGAALLAVVLGFAWIAVQSYELLHNDIASIGRTSLKPVELSGAQQTVFDWSKQKCDDRDIPDSPARAFRSADGQVHLFATTNTNRALVGPGLNQVRQDCRVVMRSTFGGRPQLFADEEWISATYTQDGRTVFALLHVEFHGQQQAGGCLTRFPQCWFNAVTLARSDDGGLTFRHAVAPPGNLVAAAPYRYQPNLRPYGLFNPSNIVQKDGWYYSMVVAQPYRNQRGGTCVMRTRNLADPRSWRAWGGDEFDVTFVDAYKVREADRGKHFCQPVSEAQIGAMSDSLTYNTYFGKYLLVGSSTAYDARKRRVVPGFYYSLSDDLVKWSQRKLVKEAELTYTYRCGDREPVLYPSVLDPGSRSRNFETTGRTPYLYWTRFHYIGCRSGYNRDLVRVPIKFSK